MAIWYMYFVVVWYIFPVLVFCAEKNLATLCKTSVPAVSRHFFVRHNERHLPTLRHLQHNEHGFSDLLFPGERGANEPGLPDGFFSDQKSQFGYILEDLAMKMLL
jgi:hypothetical protein